MPTQVAGVLVLRIATGSYPDGLAPSELQISLEFSVSRSVAREALKILSSLDMVEIAQGRRVTLRPIAEWDYLNPMLIDWLPHEQVHDLLVELQHARIIFEPAIAAEAARCINSADLARLSDILETMAQLEDQPDAYLAQDLEFHLEICRATRNRILDRFMYASRWLQSAGRRVSNQAPHALPLATEQHRRIFAALAAREPSRADAAMRVHLEETMPIIMAEDVAESG